MTQHLDTTHAEHLAASAISSDIIATRGYTSIAPGAIQAALHLTNGAYSKALLKEVLHSGALAFPVYRLGDPSPYTWVLRPELPRHREDGKAIKYEWPRA